MANTLYTQEMLGRDFIELFAREMGPLTRNDREACMALGRSMGRHFGLISETDPRLKLGKARD